MSCFVDVLQLELSVMMRLGLWVWGEDHRGEMPSHPIARGHTPSTRLVPGMLPAHLAEVRCQASPV